MRGPADPIRELARLARHPDHGCHNIGLFLRQRAAELCPAFGIEQEVLQGVSDQPDHLLAPKVVHAIDHLRERRRQDQATKNNGIASVAARALAERARWTRDAVCLDTTVLLGNLLADDTRKFIEFDVVGTQIAVERTTLVATARVVGRRPDLVASVNAGGVHIRWNGGRGGLNWYPQKVLAADREQVLRVELRKPQPMNAPAARCKSLTWDAFSELLFSP